jgi:hypothetical protein
MFEVVTSIGSVTCRALLTVSPEVCAEPWNMIVLGWLEILIVILGLMAAAIARGSSTVTRRQSHRRPHR